MSPHRIRRPTAFLSPAVMVALAGSAFVLGLTVASRPLLARKAGGEVDLTRRYRAGQKLEYEFRIEARATIHANPPGLVALLPPLPTELRARPQATVVVGPIHSDGTVNVQTRLDHFELQSNLVERLPENVRESGKEAQEDFARRLSGQTLDARFDGQGRLLAFGGANDVLERLDAPLREPVREALRLLVKLTGGSAIDPGHPVRRGEEWRRQLAAQRFGQSPFVVEGESAFRYSGDTQYHGVKAGVVDIRFENVLTPSLQSTRPMALLEGRDRDLDLRISGGGDGRVLVALDDGRILHTRATVREKVSAQFQGLPGGFSPAAGPLWLKIDTETVLEQDAR